jgi:hypothetical protein
MARSGTQAEATRKIRELLLQRGFDIPGRTMTLPDGQQWVVFQHKERQLGIDTASGIWVRASLSDSWTCIAMPCTISGAAKAVEFLTFD